MTAWSATDTRARRQHATGACTDHVWLEVAVEELDARGLDVEVAGRATQVRRVQVAVALVKAQHLAAVQLDGGARNERALLPVELRVVLHLARLDPIRLCTVVARATASRPA